MSSADKIHPTVAPPARLAGSAWLAAGLALLMAGCAGGAPQDREARADAAACRALVSSAYTRQNRADYFRESQTDMPFASTGTPGVTSAGLGMQYAYNREERSCVRGSAANIAGSNTTGEPVATPTITVQPTTGVP
jgi:hypothetical protein